MRRFRFPSLLFGPGLILLLAIFLHPRPSEAITCHVCGKKALEAYFEEEEHVAEKETARRSLRLFGFGAKDKEIHDLYNKALEKNCEDTNGVGESIPCDRLGTEYNTCVSVKTKDGKVGHMCNTDIFHFPGFPGCNDNLCACATDGCTAGEGYKDFTTPLDEGDHTGGGIKCHVCGRKAGLHFLNHQLSHPQARAGKKKEEWDKYDKAADKNCGGKFTRRQGAIIECSKISTAFKACASRTVTNAETKNKPQVWRGCVTDTTAGCTKSPDGVLEECVCTKDECNTAKRFAPGWLTLGLSLFLAFVAATVNPFFC